MKKLICVLLITAGLVGCNTVAGVGEDMAGGARKVQGLFGG